MNSVINLEQRVALLKNLSLFCHTSLSELQELASRFNEVNYPAGNIIVEENEMIDSVYVIIQGKAEVSRRNHHNENQKDILEVLSAGETIGLDEVGFFSQNSLRAETVIAITPLFTLRLTLDAFKKFLQKHPHLYPDIHKTIDEIMIHTFIKKLEPFEKISLDVLQQITPFIEKLELPADEILFHQGDTAECCYLLCSGKIDVILTKTNGTTKNIGIIEPGELLGEMALLTHSKRNATLKTITECKLLVIKQKEFQLLVEHSTGAQSALVCLLMDRHRPLRCHGVTIHTREDVEKNVVVILKNAENGVYVKTSEEGLFVWSLLDGEHTLQEISLAYFYRYRKLAVDSIGNLVVHLMQAGLVKQPLLAEYAPQPHSSKWIRVLTKIRSIMQYEYSINNVDAWVTRVYQKIGFIFFTPIAQIIMGLVAILGLIAFIKFLPHTSEILKTTPHAWVLLILMIPANLLTVPLHELAHALTTKAYGYQVHRLGIGWFWLGPMAFADTSDMWLSTRGPRIAVNLAGIYVNLVISGILAFFAAGIPNQTIAVFFWLAALSNYLVAFYNLDPLFELDGYYVLMDVLDKPNLRTHAIKWLVQDSKKTLCSLTLIRKYFPEILYWITSLLFIFLAVVVAYIIQTFLFNNIFPETIHHTSLLRHNWFLSVIVLVLSFASLYSKIKHRP